MPAGQRPLIRRRLRTELRQERERAGKSQAEVARKMEWSPSKIIRLEAGQVGVSTNDLKALLDLYDVTDAKRRDELIGLARADRQQSPWWTSYRDLVPSGEYLDYLGYETDATALKAYYSTYCPALLQTEDYAREIIRSGGADKIDEDKVDRLVELRMARKQHALDRDDPPTIHALFDEAALRRVIGGADVMSDQITSIADVASQPDITVQVVPFSAGSHPGLGGAFQIIYFADPLDPPVMQFDSSPRDVVLRDNPAQLARFETAFEDLRKIALSEEDSVAFIRQIAEEMLAMEDTESD
ncbi:helix-turn-helix domain-containing protein [Actinocatenispora comari]|jgi:transcriptional regulator with XRE-family HTH domain|uniref:Transcriptional regulator n=1 Tax=Actinocatenispora comari TaxID=2807577 RepID=A0A8J4AA73_9ACTN|nr:helix-turn-helix transcriptional regulator [Actinocatenispora comari]GIL26075.1 transcriptional regulator [Actinocatenispora comari]